jgi:hypothetical protein
MSRYLQRASLSSRHEVHDLVAVRMMAAAEVILIGVILRWPAL